MNFGSYWFAKWLPNCKFIPKLQVLNSFQNGKSGFEVSTWNGNIPFSRTKEQQIDLCLILCLATPWVLFPLENRHCSGKLQLPCLNSIFRRRNNLPLLILCKNLKTISGGRSKRKPLSVAPQSCGTFFGFWRCQFGKNLFIVALWMTYISSLGPGHAEEEWVVSCNPRQLVSAGTFSST